MTYYELGWKSGTGWTLTPKDLPTELKPADMRVNGVMCVSKKGAHNNVWGYGCPEGLAKETFLETIRDLDLGHLATILPAQAE